jgi:hypothetical protein
MATAQESTIPDMPPGVGVSPTLPIDPLGRQQPATGPFPGAGNVTLGADGSSIPDMPPNTGYGTVTPPPESWKDWTVRQLAENWRKASTARAADWGRAAADDISMGFSAPVEAYFTDEDVNKVRARNAAAQDALGPIASTALAAGTYAVGPGKFLGPLAGAAKLGRLAAAGIEGAAAGGISGYGHGERDIDKLYGDALLSGTIGVGGATLGNAIAAPGLARARAADPNFGTGTSYNLRTRAAAGEDVGSDINLRKMRSPPEMQPGLDAAYAASQRSTEPSAFTKFASQAASPAVRLFNAKMWGLPGLFLNPGTEPRDAILNVARYVNERAKNSGIQSGLDTASAAATGQPFYTPPIQPSTLYRPLVGASTTR